MTRGQTFYYLKPWVRTHVKGEGFRYDWLSEQLEIHIVTLTRALASKHRFPSGKIQELGSIIGVQPKTMIFCDICEGGGHEEIDFCRGGLRYIHNGL